MERNNLGVLYLSVILLLLGVGLITVYSASSVAAAMDPRMGDPLFFVKRQVMFIGVGLLAAGLLWRVDYHTWKRLALPIFGATLLALIATLIFGTEINNATRWLRFGPVSIQTSELAKLAAVICAAAYVSTVQERLNSFREGFVPAMIGLGAMCGLIVIQPDLGTTLFIGALTCLVLLAGGMRLRHVGVTAAVAAPLMVGAMFFGFGHVRSRIMVFLDPLSDLQGKGHQVYQSLIAIGSGGPYGKGLGESQQKLFYLPEEHTDFIFAIFTEEAGFIGAAILILLFASLTYLGHRISKHAPDRFGSLLAFGFTAMILLQAAMNMAVATSAIPTTGISLPLISFGGTGIVVALAGMGIVLNVARHAVSREAARTLRESEASEESGRQATTGSRALTGMNAAALLSGPGRGSKAA